MHSVVYFFYVHSAVYFLYLIVLASAMGAFGSCGTQLCLTFRVTEFHQRHTDTSQTLKRGNFSNYFCVKNFWLCLSCPRKVIHPSNPIDGITYTGQESRSAQGGIRVIWLPPYIGRQGATFMSKVPTFVNIWPYFQ